MTKEAEARKGRAGHFVAISGEKLKKWCILVHRSHSEHVCDAPRLRSASDRCVVLPRIVGQAFRALDASKKSKK